MLLVDDTSFRIFTVLRGKDGSWFDKIGNLRDRTSVVEPTHFHRFPGDWEAQGRQGAITLHSVEHLATTDRGVRMLRRLLQQQVQVVVAGGDPLNVGFEPGSELISLECGQVIT